MFRKHTDLKMENELLTAKYYCNLKAPSVFIKFFLFYHSNSEKLKQHEIFSVQNVHEQTAD